MSQAENRYSKPEPLGQKLVIVATSDLPRGVTSAIASGNHHRIDYLELARQHGSPYFDYSGLTQNLWRKMEQLIKLDFRLAFQVKQFADRTKAQVIACLSERVGIPLALFRPRAKIVMVAHNPFSMKKYPLIARLADRWDAISLFRRAEADEFTRRMPGIAHRIHVISPSIDTDFYRPTAQPAFDLLGCLTFLGPERPASRDRADRC